MKRFLNVARNALLVAIVLAGIAYLALPKGPRGPMEFDDPWNQDRPAVHAATEAIAAGTPWATQAGLDVLERGGTACDAAVASLLVLNATHGEASSFPSIAPLVYYDAKSGAVRSYTGAGTAPAAATLEAFQKRGFKEVPETDIYSQLLPASPDVIVSLLRDCGTMSFAELAAPAIQIAREGFPVHHILQKNLNMPWYIRLGFTILFPYNAQVYLDGQWWRPLYLKDRIRFPDLANSLQSLAAAEQQVIQNGGTREEGLQAVRDYFYKGPLAEAIVKMHQERHGLITAQDLANYQGGWEQPLQGSYGPYTFYTNQTWNQGIVVPMALQILEGIDLKAMGHNSPRYVHTVTQALELALADREAYAADPNFVKVPAETLLSKEYAAQRRKLMTGKAFGPLPPPGQTGVAVEPSAIQPDTVSAMDLGKRMAGFAPGKDTSQITVVDRWGNAIAMTPSDFPKTPMVPGTGLTLGNRMNQFRLDPASPNVLAPGKRPRVTPHAVIVFKDGQFWMSYSTPGGDMQAQALVQVFLNMEVFGIDLEQAIQAPRFETMSAPDSFAPHEAFPGTLYLEQSLYDSAARELQALGYKPVAYPNWDNQFGAVGAILRTPDGLLAGSDPREEGTAAGK